MLAPPRKRPRSPSPAPDDRSSPLDILLKRRRQKNDYPNDAEDYISYRQPSSPFEAYHEAESSNAPWTRFVEKRRTRQWERLNNPMRPERQTPQEDQDDQSSPIRPRIRYHPENQIKAPVSSSPVRHEPPSSSPFKPIMRTLQKEDEGDQEMDEDEMRREWGDEYYHQNSLLRTLHLQRASSHGPADAASPDRIHFQTPSHARATSTPHPHSHRTPYRTAIPASSPFFHDTNQPHSGLLETPYREIEPSSSPLPSQSMTQYSYNTLDSIGIGDDAMDGEALGVGEEMKSRYEATNKLLADLAMDRQKRWGG